ncbi:MAG: hypothetical protein QM581_02055 [Pseudomonas sp.]
MTTSLASRRLLSGLEQIRDALEAGDYAVLEARLGEYDAALRACFSSEPPKVTLDECRQLQQRHAELQAAMHRLRDEAAEWLRNDRRIRHAIQAYAGPRGLRRRGGLR